MSIGSLHGSYSGANNKPKQRQTTIILHCASPQVLEVYDHFHFEADKTIQRRSSKSLKSTVTREKTKFSKVFYSETYHSTSLLMCS